MGWVYGGNECGVGESLLGLGKAMPALGEDQPQTPSGEAAADPGQKVPLQCLSLTPGVLPRGRRRETFG